HTCSLPIYSAHSTPGPKPNPRCPSPLTSSPFATRLKKRASPVRQRLMTTPSCDHAAQRIPPTGSRKPVKQRSRSASTPTSRHASVQWQSLGSSSQARCAPTVPTCATCTPSSTPSSQAPNDNGGASPSAPKRSSLPVALPGDASRNSPCQSPSPLHPSDSPARTTRNSHPSPKPLPTPSNAPQSGTPASTAPSENPNEKPPPLRDAVRTHAEKAPPRHRPRSRRHPRRGLTQRDRVRPAAELRQHSLRARLQVRSRHRLLRPTVAFRLRLSRQENRCRDRRRRPPPAQSLRQRSRETQHRHHARLARAALLRLTGRHRLRPQAHPDPPRQNLTLHPHAEKRIPSPRLRTSPRFRLNAHLQRRRNPQAKTQG